MLMSFCHKKPCPPPTEINVDPTNTDQLYGSIGVKYTHNLADIYLTRLFSFNIIFNKSPMCDLINYPNISECKYNGISGYYNQNYGSISILNSPATDTSSHIFTFSHFNFNSAELGNNYFTDIDTILPSYIFNNVIDTLYLTKNTVNTFTINNTTTNYKLSTSFDSYLQSLNRDLLLGINIFKIYPNEINSLSEPSKLRLNFYKTKIITLNGRKYQFYRVYEIYYPIKLL